MTIEELLRRYKKLTKRKTNLDLSNDEALEQVLKLVTLVEAVYCPIPHKENDKAETDKGRNN